MDEKLVKELLDANAKATEELKKLLPKEDGLKDNEVSPAVKNNLQWQKDLQDKREKEFNKNGYYTGY